MKKKISSAILLLTLFCILLCGCGPSEVNVDKASETPLPAKAEETVKPKGDAVKTNAAEPLTGLTDGTDYLVLVNKNFAVPRGYESSIDLVSVSNPRGEEFTLERKTLDSFNRLRSSLAEEGIFIEINSAYRSEKEQKETHDLLLEAEGDEYVKKYVAPVEYSEHQTGLAIDVYIDFDAEGASGADAGSIWAVIHERLPEFGFILRFPKGKEEITGYEYESWHIRYVGSANIARDITSRGMTLEEFLHCTGSEKAA